MTVHLAAADGAARAASRSCSYALDGAAADHGARLLQTSPSRPSPVRTRSSYHATDVAGNVEAEKTFTVNVDTSKPVTCGLAASVVKGRTATLKYMVTESGPTAGKAAVVIKIKNSTGKVVTTTQRQSGERQRHGVGKVPLQARQGRRTRSTVYATDAAGNAQSKAGSAKLTVK